MRARAKKDIRIQTINSTGDGYDMFFIPKGTMGTVTNVSEWTRGPDGERDIAIDVVWDGFLNPRIREIGYSDRFVDIIGYEINKKGWKI